MYGLAISSSLNVTQFLLRSLTLETRAWPIISLAEVNFIFMPIWTWVVGLSSTAQVAFPSPLGGPVTTATLVSSSVSRGGALLGALVELFVGGMLLGCVCVLV